MKAYIALAIVALLNSQTEVNAVQLRQQVSFVDDMVKALADADKKEEQESTPAPKKESKPKAVEAKKDEKKKDDKKADDDIPMDTAAIKAYSSVIADAAEDSEPATPVVYNEVKEESKADQRLAQAPM